MKEKIKEVLTNAHRDIHGDVTYYTAMLNAAIDATDDDNTEESDAIARRRYHYKATARKIDALIRDILMADLENASFDVFKDILTRYHTSVHRDLVFYNKRWHEVPTDAPQDEKDRAYDRYCRYALIAERVDKLISDLLLADLD